MANEIGKEREISFEAMLRQLKSLLIYPRNFLFAVVPFLFSCQAKITGDVSSYLADGVEETEYRVFTTSTQYTGDLGGISGANSICTSVARNAGLVRNYVALLSTDTSAMNSRIQGSGPVYKIDRNQTRTLVAETLTKFIVIVPILSPLNLNEYGDTITVATWTGSSGSGGSATNNCTNWTSSSGGINGEPGNSSAITTSWKSGVNDACSSSKSLYCVSLPLE
jgi:hypothetical protein